MPSSEYFARPDLDSEQVAYKRDHIVPAARFRGRAHAFASITIGTGPARTGKVEYKEMLGELVRNADSPLHLNDFAI